MGNLQACQPGYLLSDTDSDSRGGEGSPLESELFRLFLKAILMGKLRVTSEDGIGAREPTTTNTSKHKPKE